MESSHINTEKTVSASEGSTVETLSQSKPVVSSGISPEVLVVGGLCLLVILVVLVKYSSGGTGSGSIPVPASM